MVSPKAATASAATASKKTSRRRTTVPDEFGGPLGTAATVIALPVLVMALTYFSKVGRIDFVGLWDNRADVFCPSCDGDGFAGGWRLYVLCTAGLVGWFLLLVALWVVLPGPWVSGPPVHGDPSVRLSYKLNGHATFWTVTTAVAVFRPSLDHYLYQHYEVLALCSIILSFLLATYLYLGSFTRGADGRQPKILSHNGDSGHAVYDFFMGRELNPRMSLSFFGTKMMSFDWKEFCELRPGLMGWMLLNVACLQEQFRLTGRISGSMALLNVFQAVYVWDSLYQERAILTTMDITTDGFGFMLVFGDLTWVPFTYNLPAKFLVNHDPNLGMSALVAIFALYMVGYYIFRASNLQKDVFRNDPNDSRVTHLTYMPTQRGTRLLTSGWWGCARKINYTGDYLMGLTYSLLCGTYSVVPYFYALYFAILLIHRSIRDDALCEAKYGPDWHEYKRQVPYRFIPGVV